MFKTSLGRKTLAVLAAVLLVSLTILQFVILTVLKPSYSKLEEIQVRENVAKVMEVIRTRKETLLSHSRDWSSWDDMWDYLETRSPDFEKKNLMPQALVALKIPLILILDKDGGLFKGVACDLTTQQAVSLPPSIETVLGSESPLLCRQAEEKKTGIVTTPDGELLFASSPILTSEGKGPPRGSVVFVQPIDTALIEIFAEQSDTHLEIEPFASQPADIREAVEASAGSGGIVVRPLNDRLVAGYMAIREVGGRPVLLMRTIFLRNTYRQGMQSARLLLLYVAILCFGTLVVVYYATQRLVLRRLSQLTNDVSEIEKRGDFSGRVKNLGSDEIGDLAGHVNRMMERLGQAHAVLNFEREQLLSIFESIDEAIYVVDPQDYTIQYANSRLQQEFKHQIIGEKCHWVMHRLEAPCSFCTMPFVMGENLGKPYVWDFRNPRVNRWYHCIDRAIRWPDGRWMRHEIAIDITDRKQLEERLAYSSYRDIPTGLHNRAYFQEQMRLVRTPPAAVILCDLNGLKLINDTMGHAAGDHQIKAAASVLHDCFRAGDVVARIGGDEFAVLLPDSNLSIVRKAVERIREAIGEHNRRSPQVPLSMAIGYGAGEKVPIDMNEVMAEADRRMYEDKAESGKDARSAIVAAMMTTLVGRAFVAREHTERVFAHMKDLAGGIGYPAENLPHLQLFAEYHDVGKIGISDEVLEKRGLLTGVEFEQIKRHSEIGYRIAESTPRLVHIAQWILHHHEWWDGRGYPAGLSGDQIPLECRMIAVAEAFESMLTERPHQAAVTVSEALAEIQRQAGKQFDPRLAEVFVAIKSTSQTN